MSAIRRQCKRETLPTELHHSPSRHDFGHPVGGSDNFYILGSHYSCRVVAWRVTLTKRTSRRGVSRLLCGTGSLDDETVSNGMLAELAD